MAKQTMPENYYLIRRLSDGLFSVGGDHPTFDRVGRVWRSLAHVRGHMRRATYHEPIEMVVAKIKVVKTTPGDEILPDDNPIIHMREGRAKVAVCGMTPERTSHIRENVTCANCLRILKSREQR
jgi:hypothetical protein